MILVEIDGIYCLHDSLLQILDRLEVVIVNGRAFEMAPEPLDQVQIGSIGCIPHDRQTVAIFGNERLHSLGVMNGAVPTEYSIRP